VKIICLLAPKATSKLAVSGANETLDAGIMTVILADKQFQSYYNVDSTRSGVIATIPWATTGKFRGRGAANHDELPSKH
jgi:hypothetical protein